MRASDTWVVGIAQAVLVVCSLLTLICLLMLFGLRISRGLVASRDRRTTSEIRAVLRDHLLGGWMEEANAAANIDRRVGRDWESVERELLLMVNRLRGESLDRAIALLQQRGTVDRAVGRLQAKRPVERCRAAHTLGVVAARDHSDALTSLLQDPSPLVRRVAIRALGALGNPTTAPAAVAAGRADGSMSRDVVMALARMGPGAVPHLTATLAASIATGNEASDPLLAVALGRIGDPRAIDVLCAAVASPDLGLRIAAARALGCLEDPRAVPALTVALRESHEALRVAAAEALGRIGAVDAVPDLIQTVARGDAASARSAAEAVLRLGPEGRSALDASPSPHAVEALALASLREDR